MDRILVGALSIALVASSVFFLAFIRSSSQPVSILRVSAPRSMFYSEQEYHAVVSLLARRDVEIEIRPHWLASVSVDDLREIQSRCGQIGIDVELAEVERLFPQIGTLANLSRLLGIEPEIIDFRLSREGKRERLIFFGFGSAQRIFMPEKIGQRRTRRPKAVGDYAVLINQSGTIAGFYKGYQACFYAPEQTLRYVEFDIDGDRTLYRNWSPESSKPRLSHLPLIGVFNFSLIQGQRFDMIISVDGRGLRLWRPSLWIPEILADGQRIYTEPFWTS